MPNPVGYTYQTVFIPADKLEEWGIDISTIFGPSYFTLKCKKDPVVINLWQYLSEEIIPEYLRVGIVKNALLGLTGVGISIDPTNHKLNATIHTSAGDFSYPSIPFWKGCRKVLEKVFSYALDTVPTITNPDQGSSTQGPVTSFFGNITSGVTSLINEYLTQTANPTSNEEENRDYPGGMSYHEFLRASLFGGIAVVGVFTVGAFSLYHYLKKSSPATDLESGATNNNSSRCESFEISIKTLNENEEGISFTCKGFEIILQIDPNDKSIDPNDKSIVLKLTSEGISIYLRFENSEKYSVLKISSTNGVMTINATGEEGDSEKSYEITIEKGILESNENDTKTFYQIDNTLVITEITELEFPHQENDHATPIIGDNSII